MSIIKIAGLTAATLAAVTAAAGPALARPHHPHRHQLCHMERHHHHPVRVCRWVR